MGQLIRVPFHGDELECIQNDRGVWVSVRRVCEALGLAEGRQQQKLRGKSWACTNMMLVHDTSGRQQEAFCIHIDSLPMWLATIESSRVRAEMRPKLDRYQGECAEVLRQHFLKQRPAPSLALSAESLAQFMAQVVNQILPTVVSAAVQETRKQILPSPLVECFSVLDRCEERNWWHTTTGIRKRIDRIARRMLLDRFGEVPEVRGERYVYKRQYQNIVDLAIDQVSRQIEEVNRGGLFSA